MPMAPMPMPTLVGKGRSLAASFQIPTPIPAKTPRARSKTPMMKRARYALSLKVNDRSERHVFSTCRRFATGGSFSSSGVCCQ